MSQWFRTYGFGAVYENLTIGAYPLDAEDVQMIAWGVGAKRVLNLVEDAEYDPGVRDIVEIAYLETGIEERRLSVIDFGHLPPEALDESVLTVNEWLDADLPTYVHCRAGWQRSAAVAAGVVATRTGLDIDDAVRLVRHNKPTAAPLPHQREDLRAWWHSRQRAADR